jgi:dolichyl-phosphate beta-glucosyltransferase
MSTHPVSGIYSRAMSPPDLSIIIPVLNEERGIAACVSAMRSYMDRLGLQWELIVVDDGSADGSAEIVEALAARDSRLRLIRATHAGKGAAIRRGMLEARGAWRFMADADMSMPPDNLGRFLSAVRQSPAPHIVIGSREGADARRQGEPWTRHALGRVFNWIVQAVAVPGIHDTQCGYKLFSAQSAVTLFPHARVAGFAFDVEVLLMARRAGFDVREVGITWNCRAESRVTLARGAAAFASILRIRWNAWTGRYDGARAARSAPAERLRDACL